MIGEDEIPWQASMEGNNNCLSIHCKLGKSRKEFIHCTVYFDELQEVTARDSRHKSNRTSKTIRLLSAPDFFGCRWTGPIQGKTSAATKKHLPTIRLCKLYSEGCKTVFSLKKCFITLMLCMFTLTRSALLLCCAYSVHMKRIITLYDVFCARNAPRISGIAVYGTTGSYALNVLYPYT